MDGRIPREGGKVVELDGKKGIFYGKAPEDEALERWYRQEFLDIERQFARVWRREIPNLDLEGIYRFFGSWFLIGKPKTFAEARTLSQAYIDGSPPEDSLKFGLTLFGIPDTGRQQVLHRWVNDGRPPLDDSYLFTRLWDKHMRPEWRAGANRPPLDPRASEALGELLDKIERDGKQATSDPSISIEEASFMQITRRVRRRRGKWERFGPEVK